MRAQRLADGDQQRIEVGTRSGGRAGETETVCGGKQLAQPRVRRHQNLHTLIPTQSNLVGVLGETGEDGSEEGAREIGLGNHVEENGNEVGSQQRLTNCILELLTPRKYLGGRSILLDDEGEKDNSILSHSHIFMKQITLQYVQNTQTTQTLDILIVSFTHGSEEIEELEG